MLVLMRKRGERITIGDDIVLTVVEVFNDGRVRLGIEAPKDVRILRDDANKTAPQRCPRCGRKGTIVQRPVSKVWACSDCAHWLDEQYG